MDIKILSIFALIISALLAILGIIQNAPRIIGSSILVLIFYLLLRLVI